MLGGAGIFLTVFSDLNPLDEQSQDFRRQLGNLRVPPGFFNKYLHVGGGVLKLLESDLLLWDGGGQFFLLCVVVSDLRTPAAVSGACHKAESVLRRRQVPAGTEGAFAENAGYCSSAGAIPKDQRPKTQVAQVDRGVAPAIRRTQPLCFIPIRRCMSILSRLLVPATAVPPVYPSQYPG